MRSVSKTISILSFSLVLALSLDAQFVVGLPAFPQAEGFGAYSVGGRGGKVLFVENLNDHGPGSLRAAVMDPDPRIVVFRVSGTIELESYLVIEHPFITIAGQTAPGDGICLRNYPLKISHTHDVILRGIRVRPGIGSGLTGSALDGIDVEFSHDVIIDHCSASWSSDEILNTNNRTHDITVQWSVFSESLNRSVHQKGEHGYAATIGGTRTSYHHNLFAHNYGRNPSIGGDEFKRTAQLDFRNNVVYNWVIRVCDGKPRTMNFAGNYYKPGPATPEVYRNAVVEIQASEKYGYTSKWFLENNVLEGYPELSGASRNGTITYDEGASMQQNRVWRPFENVNYRTRDVLQAYREVLDHAGVTIPARDPVDSRIIHEVREGVATFGNGIIDRVEQVGGWPLLRTYEVSPDCDNDGMPDEWEIREGLDCHNPSDRWDIKEGEVYDNLERYLNQLASDRPYLLPPVDLAVSRRGSTEVVLTWKDISDHESGFIIQRSGSDSTYVCIDTVRANVTEYIDIPQKLEASVYYRVTAFNRELNSIPTKPARLQLAAVTRKAE